MDQVSAACRPTEHKNTNLHLILKEQGIIFLSGAKHILGHFLGFFKWADAPLYALPAKKKLYAKKGG